MNEQGVRRDLERWLTTGEEKPLAAALIWVRAWLHAPQSLERELGAAKVEEIRDETVMALFEGTLPLILTADHPRALARTLFRNRLLDAHRAHRRYLGLERLADEVHAGLHAQPAPDMAARLEIEDEARHVVRSLNTLRIEERAAVLLLNLPDHLAPGDWKAVAERHPPPPPTRPSAPLEREEVAALLFPDQSAASAYERTGKLVQRAYKKLREALAPTDAPEEGDES